MIIRDVEIEGEITDIRLADGVIAEIGRGIQSGQFFDGGGGALLPGLHDHHIHLNATAAAMNSVRCGPPDITDHNQLITVLNDAQGKGWIRGVGYHHSVAGEIDRAWLDRHGPRRPIRIQHRSGRMWIINSLGMDALGLQEPDNGRLIDSDVKLRSRETFPDLKPLIQRLLRYGVTGVTEVTPSNGVAEFKHYSKNALPLRLAVMGRSELSNLTDPLVGPVKLHYHDHNLPSLDGLADEIKRAHHSGRNIAAHCVTRAELMLTLAAIEQADPLPGDRIEHAAIADDVAIDWMKRLGLIVVTQPNFIAERAAAYRIDVPKTEHVNLWRLRAFRDAGLKMAAGSDAPFGDPNPWKSMAAAVSRPSGFETESITPERALELFNKPVNDAGAGPRTVALGEVADLCLLDRPWARARSSLEDVRIVATWIGGNLVYNRVN